MTVDVQPVPSVAARLTLVARQVNVWCRRANWMLVVLALLAATYIVVLPQAFLVDLLPSLESGPGSKVFDSLDFVGRVFFGSLVVPTIETALFQWAPLRLLRAAFGIGRLTNVVVSASLFALAHTYSLGYICFAFLVGLVLAFGFLARSRPGGQAFLIVFSAHALRNLVATCARLL